ncbi:hypothetical protein [Tessaracoccus caeni]|uniref:hypothetical protein n=1 Tax=Tessaracoccus caeni TaxID=3031239 RepID=UPI0023DAA6EF|nr:hypothetical protein [Tessaracoccus caeni]MDF1487605.1 hypothetical protein [Tessaracoccus caeni]
MVRDDGAFESVYLLPSWPMVPDIDECDDKDGVKGRRVSRALLCFCSGFRG